MNKHCRHPFTTIWWFKKIHNVASSLRCPCTPQIESTEEESKDFAPKMKDMLGDVAGRSVVPAACCPYPDPAEVCFALSAAAQLVRILPGSKGCVMCLFKLCANENSENSSLMAEKNYNFLFIKTRLKMVDFQFKIYIKRRCACK